MERIRQMVVKNRRAMRMIAVGKLVLEMVAPIGYDTADEIWFPCRFRPERERERKARLSPRWSADRNCPASEQLVGLG